VIWSRRVPIRSSQPPLPPVGGEGGLGGWREVTNLTRLGSRIAVRLLAFNLLLVFLPAASLRYLDVYERQLLDAQERAMVQQGRVLAAALSERGGLRAADAETVLVRLRQQSEARLRVVDRDGRVLADSSELGPRREPEPVPAPREPRVRDAPLYRLGAWLYRTYQGLWAAPAPVAEPESPDAATAPVLRTPEVRDALAGRYGARTRMSPGGQRSVTLHSAVPVLDGGRVVGAVHVSQSTARLFRVLDQTRLGVFHVFLASVALAAVLSLLVSTTIVRPLRRLRDEAAAVLDRRGRLRGRFRGSSRRDEIGELARALEELGRRLEDHARFTESFAADLAHELKNPLASIRSAGELLAEVHVPAERRRFLDIVQREVARVEHLLAACRELARIDAGIETEDRPPVDLDGLLATVVEGYRLRGRPGVRFELFGTGGPLVLRGAPERLTQVFENLLDNAVSFSPPAGAVRIELARRDGMAVTTVSDEGPGLRPGSESLIFSRFYTERPGAAEDGHTGLGLALVKAIVEGYGGSVRAATRPTGGAAFTVRLPCP
jgi:two-component system, OmpR family, sensor histidine kinase ChvG